jgi:arsenite-transporting ATPase
LRGFADALYDDEDPTARFGTREPLAVRRHGDRLLLELKLPFTEHDDLDVGRTGDELLVRVGPYRRSLVLPDALRRRMVDGAELREGTLTVTFGDRASGDVPIGATAARA